MANSEGRDARKPAAQSAAGQKVRPASTSPQAAPATAPRSRTRTKEAPARAPKPSPATAGSNAKQKAAAPSSSPPSKPAATEALGAASAWALVGILPSALYQFEDGWRQGYMLALGVLSVVAWFVLFRVLVARGRSSRRVNTMLGVFFGLAWLVPLAADVMNLGPEGTQPAPAAQSSAAPEPTSPTFTVDPSADEQLPLITEVLAADPFPEREIYSTSARPALVALNALHDDPVAGSQPDFMQVKVAEADDSTFTSRQLIRPGSVYTVRVAYSNSSAGTDTEGARLRLAFPGVLTGQGAAYAYLSAANASPLEVGDGVVLVTEAPEDQVAARYVSGSATITQGPLAGTALNDDLFDEGILIGCAGLDGILPPGPACDGVVEFQVRVDQPNFEVEVTARDASQSDNFASTVALVEGSVLRVRAVYTNTGSNDQDDVHVRVSLPPGLRVVSGTFGILNANNPASALVDDSELEATGVDIGSYTPGSNAIVGFDVLVEDATLGGAPEVWVTVRDLVQVNTNSGTKDGELTFLRAS